MNCLSFNKLKNKGRKIVWRGPFSGSLFKPFIIITNINPLLVYCNEREHSTTGYAPREINERSKESEFIQNVKQNTAKSRRIKKDKDEKYVIGLKVRISNYRTLLKDDRFIYYTAPSFVRKSDFKESFHAVGKILLNRRNYWLVKITQEDKQRKDLKVGEERKIDKKYIKLV